MENLSLHGGGLNPVSTGREKRKRRSITVEIKPTGEVAKFVGRDCWLLEKLIEKGERGVTAFDEIGPRLSHYAHKLRRGGITIETIREAHGGEFYGSHGRYVLRSDVEVISRQGGDIQ